MSDETPDQSPERDLSDARSPSSEQAVEEYRERLWVPVGWWVLGTLFSLSMLVAVLFYLGPVVALITFVVLQGIIVAGFISYGRLRVSVAAERLWVGPANIEWRYVAAARALDEVQSRQRRGPQSDARAFMMLRPYLTRTVEITIDDADDPTPYWLVASRHPQRLAAAVNARISHPGATPER
jgi:hypothetical protein